MNQTSNKIKYLLMTKAVNFSTDTFKLALMNNAFIFSPTVNVWSDVSAYELPAAYGYVAGGVILTGSTVTEDDVNNKCTVAFNDAQWTASGGAIGPSNGAIIYDTSVNNSIIGFIEFNPPKTQASGGIFTVTNIGLELS